MNSGGRYIVSLCIGLASALLGWSVLELILSLQNYFPGYTMLLLATGGLTGACMTAVMASIEGILHKNTVKIHKEWTLGFIWGLAGGMLGAMGGQILFNMILPDNLMPESYIYPYYAARIVSWAFLGAFIGTAEGIRSRSSQKITAGLISGILAGLIGGSIVETAMLLFPQDSWLKLPGFMIMGIGTAVLTIFIEEKTSPGVFRVLNGSSKGRKYLLNQRKITLGSRHICDITLQGDEKIPPLAVILKRKGKELVLESNGGFPIFINDEGKHKAILKYEDVIKIGNLKFLYEVNS
ncbi:FHA domain-containing protein [Oceanispirochaeta sp.]|jgi:hypothetical protein|uniref:FHA domain-containing protein n=1 Tax=Oceanispirochaeta sp. TaxID=2035350 RepID=UPI00261BDDBC|nr:FHA domain-containing protein [Oceanispirochaeta sp.]MDA3958235.1 hypothetical protein [Oceanispirochaeta sp.]